MEVGIGGKEGQKVTICTVPAEVMQQVLDAIGQRLGVQVKLEDIVMFNFSFGLDDKRISFVKDDTPAMDELIRMRRKAYKNNGRLPPHMMWVLGIPQE